MMINKHALLLETVAKKITLSESEREYLQTSFQYLQREKSDHLIAQGTVVQHLYFVLSGYCRAYHYTPEGEEITNNIASRGEFVTAFEGFINGCESKESIQCITACEVLMISKDRHDSLYDQITNWSVYCRSVYEFHILKMAERLAMLQNLSAADRYEKLLRTQPGLAQNAAIKYLASYLGIRPQSLSRLRKTIK